MPTMNTNPDHAIFSAIARWHELWRAIEELPDHNPRADELARQAMDIEWDVAESVPLTIRGYEAKRDAIVLFEFDAENFHEFVFQLGVDAGRLGVDCEMPDRAPR